MPCLDQNREIHFSQESVSINRTCSPPSLTMLNSLQNPQTWQQSLFSSFIAMAEAEDGDFTAIDQLLLASADHKSLYLTVQHLSQHPHCQKALAHRQPLPAIDLAALYQLPTDTLGYHYAHHMLSHQLKHLEVQPVDSAIEFIDTHLRETHDIWHVVTGSPVSMLGEIKLQGFCVAQLQLSRFWMALLTKNLLKSLIYDIEVADQYMTALTTGWMMGKTSQPLFGVDWITQWQTPIDQVRASLNITMVEFG
jgi:ubiquinone biosynthesis protein COQ4